MKPPRTYQVKHVTQIAGISARTLHHYDEIGLLVPRGRSAAGYRLYDDEDLLRLQQILISRELGLSLEEIRRSLDDPSFDRKRALLAQREQLARRAHETAEMIHAIDHALSTIDSGGKETRMDMKQIFNGFHPSEYDDEARERWGGSAAYAESIRRTRRYTTEDWQRFGAEQAAIYADAVAALRSGKRPDEPEVMDIAERHRASIERWFYPCSPDMHRALADGYELDPRFAENIDKHGAGLTPFLVAAMRANSDRQPSP